MIFIYVLITFIASMALGLLLNMLMAGLLHPLYRLLKNVTGIIFGFGIGISFLITTILLLNLLDLPFDFTIILLNGIVFTFLWLLMIIGGNTKQHQALSIIGVWLAITISYFLR